MYFYKYKNFGWKSGGFPTNTLKLCRLKRRFLKLYYIHSSKGSNQGFFWAVYIWIYVKFR